MWIACLKQVCHGYPSDVVVFPKEVEDLKTVSISVDTTPDQRDEGRLEERLFELNDTKYSAEILKVNVMNNTEITTFINANGTTNENAIEMTRKQPMKSTKIMMQQINSTAMIDHNKEDVNTDLFYDPRYSTRARLNCKCKIANRCVANDKC